MSVKNILMLTTEMTLGGAEKVFYDHICAFSENYSVKVCLFTKSGYYKGFKLENEVFELDDKKIKNYFKRWLNRKHRLESIISSEKIDICISHMEGPNFLNAATNSLCHKILVVHGSVLNNSQKNSYSKFLINKFLIPLLYCRAQKVVAVSDGLRNEHLRLGLDPSKVICINNFFSTKDIYTKSVENTVLDKVFTNNNVLVHAGRLAVEKNQVFLLNLLKHMRNKGRHEKLVLVGGGSLKGSLIGAAKDLGLSVLDLDNEESALGVADVYFTGIQQNPYKFIAKAKLFLLSSFNEGFPLVLGESLSCGTPIVAVDCPSGPRELLSEPGSIYNGAVESYVSLFVGNLVSYFPTGFDIWEAAILDIIDNPEKAEKLRQNCALKAAQFDKEGIIVRWYKLFESFS